MRAALPALLALGLLAACTGAPAADAPSSGDPIPGIEAPVPRLDWQPAGPPRARLLALHGFNDHMTAFAGFGAYAAARGIAVEAYDQSGFGTRSNHGQWPGTTELLADLYREIGRLRAAEPRVPVYVLGESMGGAVVALALAQPEAPRVDGIILSAPAVWGGDTLGPLYRATLAITAAVMPGLELTGRRLGILASDNLEMLRELGRDPLFIKATRVDAIAGLVGLMDQARAAAPAIPGPLLVLTGANDQVIRPDVQAGFVATLTARPCTAAFYPDGWHLLLRDLEREVVWRDILAWIDRQPLPSGRGEPCAAAGAPIG
jgi:alpha-beta hydrolase superfamily lysophospholipase